MAYTNLAGFFDRLRIQSYTFELGTNLLTSKTGGGDILTAQTGPRLWQGSVSLAAMSHAQARETERLIIKHTEAASRFAWVDKKGPQFPSEDPTGSKHGNRALTWTVDAYGLISIRTLPVGYALNAGDRFNLVARGRRYLLEYDGARTTASNNGILALQSTTTPFVPPTTGATTTQSALLMRPFVIAMIVPGSFKPFSYEVDHAKGASFDWIQVLKE